MEAALHDVGELSMRATAREWSQEGLRYQCFLRGTKSLHAGGLSSRALYQWVENERVALIWCTAHRKKEILL